MALSKAVVVSPVGITNDQKGTGIIHVDSREDGMREGNRRNVAATITQGLIMAHGYKIADALKAYDEVHAHLVSKDQA